MAVLAACLQHGCSLPADKLRHAEHSKRWPLDQLDFTLKYIAQHSLQAILLAPGKKRPPPGQFPITSNASEILEHLIHEGNLGILGGPIAILDFDRMDLANEMFLELGIPEPTVRTGSGKVHCYVQDTDLPARIKWHGETVGEIQRGAKQYVVAPPSIHPNGTGYTWLIEDSKEPIPRLPGPWRQYLLAEMVPTVPQKYQKYIGQETPLESWDGPAPEEIVRLALQQPGAVRRVHGIKFQCPGCRDEGHDRHRDNAMVGFDGRWGCAFAPGDVEHKRKIGIALGVFSAEPLTEARAKEEILKEDIEDDDPTSLSEWRRGFLQDIE